MSRASASRGTQISRATARLIGGLGALGGLGVGGCDRTPSEDGARAESCAAAARGELPPLPVRFVVLSDHPDAPKSGDSDESVTACPPDDTRWPCSHLTALSQRFLTATGDPICATDNPAQCLSFAYAGHAFLDDIRDTSDPGCQTLLQLGSRDVWPGLSSGQVYDELRYALSECEDPAIYDPETLTMFIFDNPLPGLETSFGVGWASSRARGCGAHAFLEVGRLPTDGSAVFGAAANEHELGHVLGLDHTCALPSDPDWPASNIMQGTGSSCCCECAVDRNEDTGGPWATQQCVDCSAVDTEDACPDEPYAWDWCAQPDCTSQISNGQRDQGFSDTIIGDWSSDQGQLRTLLTTAAQQWTCWCEGEDAVSG